MNKDHERAGHLTIEETARALSLAPTTIMEHVNRGSLGTVTIAGERMVKMENVVAMHFEALLRADNGIPQRLRRGRKNFDRRVYDQLLTALMASTRTTTHYEEDGFDFVCEQQNWDVFLKMLIKVFGWKIHPPLPAAIDETDA